MSQWWIKKNTGYEVNEYLEPGLRYTEEIGYTVHSVPVRYCCLWLESEEGPISDLEVLSFKQRFGAVSVPAEGIGGVETLPKFRRQGYMTKLLTKTVEGMARRVDVAFVSEAIEGVYEKFGFVPCLADAHLLLKVRHIERLLNNNAETTDRQNLREFTPDDRPRMVSLYNEAHAHRPWTHERHPGWDRLVKQEIWAPGSEVLVLEESENLVGYAILEGQRFGRESSVFIVDEFTAKDSQAARRLLAELASVCWQRRLREFLVREPLDSVVGQEARRLGCEHRQSYPASGGMMGAILNRQRLLQALEPELRRRLNCDEWSGEHKIVFNSLQQGDLAPDNRVLLRLLVGYWSVADAQTAGAMIPVRSERICAAWFPVGARRHCRRLMLTSWIAINANHD